MLDVHLPLADGRELVLPRYTQPEPEHRLVLEKLGWELPAQPPPRIRSPKVSPGGSELLILRVEKPGRFWPSGVVC
jgi:hypothetical protein